MPDTVYYPLRAPHIVTRYDLAAHGLTPDDVRRRCPTATEYASLDGEPCWLADDLTELMGGAP